MSQYEIILAHIPLLLLVFFRIGGLMIFAPIFGSNIIPVKVRVLFSMLAALSVYPLLSDQLLGELHLELSLFTIVPVVALDLLLGVLIGFIATLPMIAVQTGGLIMGQQMGLGFARFYNPAVDDEADVIGQIMFFMLLVGFLLIGGHESLLLAVLHSFEHIPPGVAFLDMDLIDLLTGLLTASFELALRVAAPLLALVFLQSVAMGFVAKTVPQLNILSLGFPLRILVGFGVIGFGLVIINDVLMDGIDAGLIALFDWIHTSRPS